MYLPVFGGMLNMLLQPFRKLPKNEALSPTPYHESKPTILFKLIKMATEEINTQIFTPPSFRCDTTDTPGDWNPES